jgi:hypothetical protein
MNPLVSNDLKIKTSATSHQTPWYLPTFSPEHGVYIMLFVSFLIGASAAQRWNLNTTLALIVAFMAFQAEHPLTWQIKQRKTLKPRLIIWGGIYGAIALFIAIYLSLQTPVLLWIYFGGIITLILDMIAVFYRQQRSIINEIITFGAVCLSTPLAYSATLGETHSNILALWLFNTLFFASAIFRVKLRKPKTSSPLCATIYHLLAIGIISLLWLINQLQITTVIAFAISPVTFVIVSWQIDWYKNLKIHFVALIETLIAIMFLLITTLSLLPVHLS